MATSITPNVYPLDLTMSLDSNHIRNEVKEFKTANDRIFVPNGGPFFETSLIIKNSDGKPLKPIVDYEILYMNEQATLASNRTVCSVIRVVNDAIHKVHLEYRVIGGEYGNTVYAIKQEVANAGTGELRVDWHKNVYNKPSEFPPAPHFHSGYDFKDWDNVLWQLSDIKDAILAGDLASWASVYRYFDRQLDVFTLNVLNNVNSQFNNVFNNYATKEELNNAKVKLSKQSGNLIEEREDGIYYGIQAPPNLTNLYVDAIEGNDNNDGSKARPFKTLDKALSTTPNDKNGTIWVRCIQDAQVDTVAYSISKRYVFSNCTKIIRSYDHPLIDGAAYAEANRIVRGVLQAYTIRDIPRPAIRLKWYDLFLGTVKYSGMAGFTGNNINMVFHGLEFHVEQLENLNTRHPYGEYSSLIFGRNAVVEYQSSCFYRIVKDHDITNWTRDRPTDVTNTFYDPRWNNGFIVFANVNVDATLVARNMIVGYSGGKRGTKVLTGRPQPAKIFDNSYMPAVSDANHALNLRQGVESFICAKGALDLKINLMERYAHNYEMWGTAGLTVQPSNLKAMVSHCYGIWGAKFIGDICVNISAPDRVPIYRVIPAEKPTNVYDIKTANVPNADTKLIDLLGFRDGIDEKELAIFIKGMSYYRMTSTKLKTLDLSTENGAVFGTLNPTGIQVTLYNATNNEIIVNQMVASKNHKRIWLPQSALTLIFISKLYVDVIGGMVEE